MSKWDKLIEEILKLNRNLRFDDLTKALIKIGYTQNQPKGGGSHYTFRKESCAPVTLPKSKSTQIDIVYIRQVREAIMDYLTGEDGEQ
ncbi:MAG: toxin HicA [Oscillospiraceae bacterium]|nr:toxin HicA [Oscillospiraceae bacterium]